MDNTLSEKETKQNKDTKKLKKGLFCFLQGHNLNHLDLNLTLCQKSLQWSEKKLIKETHSLPACICRQTYPKPLHYYYYSDLGQALPEVVRSGTPGRKVGASQELSLQIQILLKHAWVARNITLGLFLVREQRCNTEKSSKKSILHISLINHD